MNYDLRKYYKNYKGLWIALDDSLKKVLASGKNAKSVYDKAKSKDGEGITLFKVPAEDVAFAGRA